MGQNWCFLCLEMLSLHPQLNMHSWPQTICPSPQVTWALLQGLGGPESPKLYWGDSCSPKGGVSLGFLQ